MEAELKYHVLKFLRPAWAKDAQNDGENGRVFFNGYNELALLCNGTVHVDRYEILAKTVSRCALMNLNRRLLKFSVMCRDFAPKLPLSGCLDGSPRDRATGQ